MKINRVKRILFFVAITLLITNTLCLASEQEKPCVINHYRSTGFLPAQITITRPQPGHFYLFDREVLPLPSEKTIIIGKITIFVSAIDTIYGIKTVDFIIDGDITHTCFLSPYFWTWNTRTYPWGNHILTVTATNGNDEKFSDQMSITVLSLRRGGLHAV